MDALVKNWKTTLSGIAVVGLTAAFVLGHLTVQQFLGAFGTLAGGGLVLASDGKQ